MPGIKPGLVRISQQHSANRALRNREEYRNIQELMSEGKWKEEEVKAKKYKSKCTIRIPPRKVAVAAS